MAVGKGGDWARADNTDSSPHQACPGGGCSFRLGGQRRVPVLAEGERGRRPPGGRWLQRSFLWGLRGRPSRPPGAGSGPALAAPTDAAPGRAALHREAPGSRPWLEKRRFLPTVPRPQRHLPRNEEAAPPDSLRGEARRQSEQRLPQTLPTRAAGGSRGHPDFPLSARVRQGPFSSPRTPSTSGSGPAGTARPVRR